MRYSCRTTHKQGSSLKGFKFKAMAALQLLGVLDALNTGPPTKTMIARGFRKIVCALKGRWLVSIEGGTAIYRNR